MTVNEVIAELQAIVTVHPDAGAAQVWGRMRHDGQWTTNFRVTAIGYDHRHHPPRMQLEN